MLAIGILYGSVFFTLISPLVAASVLSATFFFKGTQDRFERTTYRLVRFFYLFTFCSSVLALLTWCFTPVSHGSFSLAHFQFGPNFFVNLRIFFDRFSLIFLMTSAFISALITFFSHRYLHRDPGYRRFFITISLFAFGMNLIVLAGTFDLIFAGWEIVGLSSFLLIGYFWHRPKAIAAACRAYNIYRICDLGLLASLLITHFFWHDVSIFSDFLNTNMHSVLSHVSGPWRWLLSICILLPVIGKSAQFPLCFWLPKAMEGPTHSSAIFYGSLSIHVGVFLLIRTMPIWYFTPGFTYLLATIGILTAFSATLFALVQSNIKGQIGYASIAQVGLMLVELSLGLTTIAFVHMIGNAFLRCFQLLVSSSILNTHLHMQNVVRTFGKISRFSLPQIFPKRWRPSLYVFAINDGFFEDTLIKIFVTPTMTVARTCNELFTNGFIKLRTLKFDDGISSTNRYTLPSFSPLLAMLCLGVIVNLVLQSFEFIRLLSLASALILALSALGERKKAARALILAIFSNLFAFLSITSSRPGLLYLLGLVTSSIIALEALYYINARRHLADLSTHQGLYQQFPLAGTLFLIGILGIVSFPFSSTFYGEDVLFSLIINSGLHYLLIFQFIFILNGVAMIRIYSRVIFGRRDNFMKDVNLDFSSRQTFVRLALFIIGNTAAFVLALT